VILDRDGVLTDFDLEAAARFFSPRVPLSVWEIFDRWQAWGEQRGFPRTTVEERSFFVGFWDSLCDELGLSTATRSDLQQFDYTTCLTVYPDVIPALQAAHAANLRIGVLSNFTLATLDESLRTTGLATWVDIACAAMVIGVSKPDPAAYTITAARLGVTTEQCLFFDDEQESVAGALACGMQAYHVDRALPAHDIAAGKVADLSGLVSLLDQIVLKQQG
jgi:putative hydrolase of the HAD superfamily